MIRHRAFVPVPPARAWRILKDIPGWPVWAPTIRAARALDAPGLVPEHRFLLRQPVQPETVWHVVAVEPGHAFRWRTQGGRGFEAGHRIEVAAGGCVVHADLRPTGRAMRAAWPFMRPILRHALWAEARGLTRACIAGITPSGGRYR